MRGDPTTPDDVIGRRIVATLLDSVVVFAVLYAGIMAFGGGAIARTAGIQPAVVVGFYLWFVFAVLGFAPLLVMHDYSPVWFGLGVGLWVTYGTVFEASLGATPGKLATGIVAVREDGRPLRARDAVGRNVLRVVDGLGFYLVGFLVLATNASRQRLGDLLADTIVARRD